MKPAKIIVICIAAVAAIGLALVVRAMGNSGQPAQVAQAAPAPVDTRPKTKILVAAKNLDPGQRLTEADMTWKEWPIDSLDPTLISDGSNSNPAGNAEPARPDGAIATVARAATAIMNTGVKSDYIGAVVREAILEGEPILARKIVLAGDSGYLAAYLEPGMRAMSIRVSVETAAGGFILPGDRVDVLLTRDNGQQASAPGQPTQATQARFMTSTVMRNVKVLAIDQTTRAEEGAQAVVGATATLQLAPGDAEALALAKSEGELSLVLRSYADTGGPSGRVQQPPRVATNVRVFRGGAPEVVVVQ